MWNTVRNSNNPQEMMQQMVSSNPEFKKLVDTVNSLGDPRTAFYTLAKKQGVDPDSILSLLK